MITLKEREWKKILEQLKEDWSHKPSVFLLRSVMRRELGFTDRRHEVWSPQHGYDVLVYLDFFDDACETMFRLKYL